MKTSLDLLREEIACCVACNNEIAKWRVLPAPDFNTGVFRLDLSVAVEVSVCRAKKNAPSAALDIVTDIEVAKHYTQIHQQALKELTGNTSGIVCRCGCILSWVNGRIGPNGL